MKLQKNSNNRGNAMNLLPKNQSTTNFGVKYQRKISQASLKKYASEKN